MKKGYSISGVAQEVDHYCEGKNVIGYDELGGLKIAYVLGEKTALPQGKQSASYGNEFAKNCLSR